MLSSWRWHALLQHPGNTLAKWLRDHVISNSIAAEFCQLALASCFTCTHSTKSSMSEGQACESSKFAKLSWFACNTSKTCCSRQHDRRCQKGCGASAAAHQAHACVCDAMSLPASWLPKERCAADAPGLGHVHCYVAGWLSASMTSSRNSHQ
jgi:hypothetical protein